MVWYIRSSKSCLMSDPFDPLIEDQVMAQFKLFMISAMYENGCNTTHCMLDGHPELFAYPYESQLGTSLVSVFLTSFVPFKYRCHEFPHSGNVAKDYAL